jgi:hypothetical protein
VGITEDILVSGVAPTVTLLNTTTGNPPTLPSQPAQTLSIKYDSPNGPGYLNFIYLLINNSWNGLNACTMYYYPEFRS